MWLACAGRSRFLRTELGLTGGLSGGTGRLLGEESSAAPRCRAESRRPVHSRCVHGWFWSSMHLVVNDEDRIVLVVRGFRQDKFPGRGSGWRNPPAKPLELLCNFCGV